MDRSEISAHLELAIQASVAAMREILIVYNSHFDIGYKEDASPVTLADRKADATIRRHLEPAGIYIMSEEAPILPYSERHHLTHLWIVDPMDGTKEFIKRNGEFTTNIALTENGIPVLGVIGVPVAQEIYFAAEGLGAFRAVLHSAGNTLASLMERASPLPLPSRTRPVRIMGSRSHTNDTTREFFEKFSRLYPGSEIMAGGSSLKLCRIAEGTIDLYPRFSPINEWDVAAGDAIIRFAGGTVTDPDTGELLRYNKESLLQYPFVAKAAGFEFDA